MLYGVNFSECDRIYLVRLNAAEVCEPCQIGNEAALSRILRVPLNTGHNFYSQNLPLCLQYPRNILSAVDGDIL